VTAQVALQQSFAFDLMAMTSELPKTSVPETLAGKIVALKANGLPAATTRQIEDLLIDVVGLCVTAPARTTIASALAGWTMTAVHGDRHRRTLTARGGLRQRHRGAWRGFRRHF